MTTIKHKLILHVWPLLPKRVKIALYLAHRAKVVQRINNGNIYHV